MIWARRGSCVAAGMLAHFRTAGIPHTCPSPTCPMPMSHSDQAASSWLPSSSTYCCSGLRFSAAASSSRRRRAASRCRRARGARQGRWASSRVSWLLQAAHNAAHPACLPALC